MKKSFKLRDIANRFPNIGLKMKLTVFLTIVSLFQIHANSYSQSKKITLDMPNATVAEVIQEIESLSDFKFLLNRKDVNLERKVSIRVNKKPIATVLSELFAGTDVVYEVMIKQIVLRKVFQKPLQSKTSKISSATNTSLQFQVSGTVTDSKAVPLTGASILEKGTTNGVQTDFDGNFSIAISDENATLVFSYIGFASKEMAVDGQATINVQLAESAEGLEEVVVVGYGTKKKVNLTGAISVIGQESLEDRPISNVQQGLQGMVPNLNITTTSAGGEPGAEMSMNIRGLQSFEGTAQPYILVDNIPMEINDVDPDNIASISILKDAAASAIYGARAAYGVILITTKKGSSGGTKFSYSNNFAISTPTTWPDFAETMDFALTMNESSINSGSSPILNQERLANLAMNIANPGSAPEMYPNADGTGWDEGAFGVKSSGDYDWNSIIFKDWAPQQKHNLSVSGGNEKINYYIAGGFINDQGILRYGDESFARYNLDAKLQAEATSWMDIALLVKYRNSKEDFPWHNLGRGRIFDLITKIKPTNVPKYPGTDIWNQNSRIAEWQVFRDVLKKRQLVVSPRIILEPIKDWVTNIDFNYVTNDNNQVFTEKPYYWIRPNEELVQVPSPAGTLYQPNMYSNVYMSPNIYSTYTKSFGKHNLEVLAGYQQETYKYFDLMATSTYVLSSEAASLSTAVGETTVTDQVGHWATQSFFGRFNYNYGEKYLVEMNIRRDGSSRFDPDNRWSVFPSFSAGWVVSKENFFPLKDQIDFFKIRGSYGSLGNQNVDNYLYVPTLPISESRWLFNGVRAWTVGSPNLTSVNLTWEEISTLDFGFDLTALDNRLAFSFDWYESRTTNLVGPGIALPAVLGTSVPKTNEGEINTEGWEIEVSWKNMVNNNFSYGFRGVLSDNQSKVTQYNNPTKILTVLDEYDRENDAFYQGKDLGEIWGYDTAGLYQDQNDLDTYGIDQSYIYSGNWNTGDVKYIDQNGDGKIDIGNNTLTNPGDKKVIGNSNPRFQYGFGGNATYKDFDFSFYAQGIAKRDLDLRGIGTFRGPAIGPFHATVYKEHMDYFRDDTSPLGANPDAYFPRPYSEYTGRNDKNYGSPTDRYLQSGAYIRLKNVQLGYTLPKALINKVDLSNARIYVSGENLLTFTNLMFYDPEGFAGSYKGTPGTVNSTVGKAYPLNTTLSLGLNINF